MARLDFLEIMRGYTYPCAIALSALTLLYKSDIFYLDVSRPGSQSVIFVAFFYGMLFGVSSCPFCGISVGSALIGEKAGFFSLLKKSMVFHGFRFLSIFIFASAGGSILSFIQTQLPRVSAVMNSFLMLAIGVFFIAGKRFNLSARGANVYSSPKTMGSFWYGVWGVFTGCICSFEAIGFLAPFWSVGTETFTKVAAFLIFSFSATLMVSFLISCMLGVKFTLEYVFRESIFLYLRRCAGFFLFFSGVLFFLKR